jgi:hypothetical protein
MQQFLDAGNSPLLTAKKNTGIWTLNHKDWVLPTIQMSGEADPPQEPVQSNTAWEYLIFILLKPVPNFKRTVR